MPRKPKSHFNYNSLEGNNPLREVLLLLIDLQPLPQEDLLEKAKKKFPAYKGWERIYVPAAFVSRGPNGLSLDNHVKNSLNSMEFRQCSCGAHSLPLEGEYPDNCWQCREPLK